MASQSNKDSASNSAAPQQEQHGGAPQGANVSSGGVGGGHGGSGGQPSPWAGPHSGGLGESIFANLPWPNGRAAQQQPPPSGLSASRFAGTAAHQQPQPVQRVPVQPAAPTYPVDPVELMDVVNEPEPLAQQMQHLGLQQFPQARARDDYPHPHRQEDFDEYSHAMGIRSDDHFCLGCGQRESDEHRAHWLECSNICFICLQSAENPMRHYGTPCSGWYHKKSRSWWVRREPRRLVQEKVKHLYKPGPSDALVPQNAGSTASRETKKSKNRGRGAQSHATQSGRIRKDNAGDGRSMNFYGGIQLYAGASIESSLTALTVTGSSRTASASASSAAAPRGNSASSVGPNDSVSSTGRTRRQGRSGRNRRTGSQLRGNQLAPLGAPAGPRADLTRQNLAARTEAMRNDGQNRLSQAAAPPRGVAPQAGRFPMAPPPLPAANLRAGRRVVSEEHARQRDRDLEGMTLLTQLPDMPSRFPPHQSAYRFTTADDADSSISGATAMRTAPETGEEEFSGATRLFMGDPRASTGLSVRMGQLGSRPPVQTVADTDMSTDVGEEPAVGTIEFYRMQLAHVEEQNCELRARLPREAVDPAGRGSSVGNSAMASGGLNAGNTARTSGGLDAGNTARTSFDPDVVGSSEEEEQFRTIYRGLALDTEYRVGRQPLEIRAEAWRLYLSAEQRASIPHDGWVVAAKAASFDRGRTLGALEFAFLPEEELTGHVTMDRVPLIGGPEHDWLVHNSPTALSHLHEEDRAIVFWWLNAKRQGISAGDAPPISRRVLFAAKDSLEES